MRIGWNDQTRLNDSNMPKEERFQTLALAKQSVNKIRIDQRGMEISMLCLSVRVMEANEQLRHMSGMETTTRRTSHLGRPHS